MLVCSTSASGRKLPVDKISSKSELERQFSIKADVSQPVNNTIIK